MTCIVIIGSLVLALIANLVVIVILLDERQPLRRETSDERNGGV